MAAIFCHTADSNVNVWVYRNIFLLPKPNCYHLSVHMTVHLLDADSYIFSENPKSCKVCITFTYWLRKQHACNLTTRI